MDKQQKERIRIRINGKEKPFLSEDELNQEIAASQESVEQEMEIIPHQQPYFENAQREPIEKRHEMHSFYKKKKKYGTRSFERSKLLLLKSKHPFFFQGKKKRTPLAKIPNLFFNKFVAAILLAMLIGIGFGYIVLSLFSNMVSMDEEGTSSGNRDKLSYEEQGEIRTLTQVEEKALSTSGFVPLQVEVVQGGAFTTYESANQYVENMRENGLPSVLLPNSNPVLMFIGIGRTKEELDGLSQRYLEKGQDIYIKSYALQGVNFSFEDEQEHTRFVTATVQLFQALVSLSATAFDLGTITEEDWQEVKKVYEQWEQMKAEEKLPSVLEQFSQQMIGAYHSLSNFRQDSANDTYLWDSQQYLLEGLVIWNQASSF